MSFDKYTDRELWEINKGIATAIESYKPNKTDNVFMFWYELFKGIDGEINRRMLADY